MLFGIEKVLPLVPAVGGVLLVISSLFARTILSVLRRGSDEAQKLKHLPARSRLPALEVIENVLQIDKVETESLTSEQRFGLITHVLELRQSEAKRRLYLMIAFAILMFLLSALWIFYSTVNSYQNDSIRQAIRTGNIENYNDQLAARGYFNVKDEKLVYRLASITANLPPELREQIAAFEKIVNCNSIITSDCNRALIDLRMLARDRKPPFNEPGIYLHASINRNSQPRRFFTYVAPNFPFKDSAIQVVNPFNDTRRLTLLPRVAINTADDKNLIQLNEEQILWLFGSKDITSASRINSRKLSVVVLPVSLANPVLHDPECSKFWLTPGRSDRLCKLTDDYIDYDKLIDKLSD